MTTTFEVRFTNPSDFFHNLAADARLGHVEDSIVRMAVRNAGARVADLEIGRSWDTRPAPWHKRISIEATYLARGQLLKLSVYCGLVWGGPAEKDVPADDSTDETIQLLSERLEDYRTRIAEAGDALDLRAGAMFVEDEAWVASPDDTIETPVPAECATCKTPIYFANALWRHATTGSSTIAGNWRKGRAEATVSERPARGARGQALLGSTKLIHLADPKVEGRLV